MQRFFVDSAILNNGKVGDFFTVKDKELLHQLNRVLRARVGDKYIFLDGAGNEYKCELKQIFSESAEFIVLQKKINETEPDIFVTIYQALPKKMELFEWVLQKGTEIGVSKFVPIITARTERENFPKMERLEKILRESAEQSERGIIPQLTDITKLESLLKDSDKLSYPKIILHSRGNFPHLSTFLPDIRLNKKCEIIIGPEGGLSEDEILAAQNNGLIIASLGNRILRTETAGIVAVSVVLHVGNNNISGQAA